MDAAPLACAGVTTYKAVKVSGARTGDLVSVIGIGGLGHLAVQYAVIAGATVVAVDVEQDKLNLARDLGATYTVDASTQNVSQVIQDLGGADVAIVLAVQRDAVEQAFASLRRGGRLVLVSLPKDGQLQVPIFETVLNGITILGSIVGTRQDLAEDFALHAAGRTRVTFRGQEARRHQRRVRRRPRRPHCRPLSHPGEHVTSRGRPNATGRRRRTTMTRPHHPEQRPSAHRLPVEPSAEFRRAGAHQRSSRTVEVRRANWGLVWRRLCWPGADLPIACRHLARPGPPYLALPRRSTHATASRPSRSVPDASLSRESDDHP